MNGESVDRGWIDEAGNFKVSGIYKQCPECKAALVVVQGKFPPGWSFTVDLERNGKTYLTPHSKDCKAGI